MLLDSMFKEIKSIMMSIDIKYKSKGEGADTTETRFMADRYLNAYQGFDNFFSYETYYVDAIKNSGLNIDDVTAAEYALNPISIPEMFREDVLREQRKLVIENYEEGNDYFRILSGLPASGDDWVYAGMQFYEDYGIDFKAVHQFTNTEIIQLTASGELGELKQVYPNLKYLNYLGEKKIIPYVSRRADNFQILRSTYEGDLDLLDRFMRIYDQNREYVMSVLYVKEFSTTKPYYDNFMAMIVAIMTVQRLLVDVLKSGIEMDFYDTDLLRLLFDSYNVPYIEGLPKEYQKLLVRNMNKLLHYKSTDKVLYDISEILGFDNNTIYKYFLVKNHRLDENGKPIFEYIENEDGDMVENAEAMYDIYFQAMDIKEENEEFALLDSYNRYSYETIAAEDPYWWDDDDELKRKLYQSDFNYIETKYLHMNVMYKLTEMIFEIVHIYRIMQDRRSDLANMTLSMPKILPFRKINLFTYTMFMCAAIAKRNGLTGEIITSPSQTLYLFGFDFGKDLTLLKEAIQRDSKYVDMDTISKYIYDTDMRTASDVDRIYNNIKALWEFLSKKLKNSRTIEEYRAYERLYRAIHVTEDMSSVFIKSDGEIASTYLDMLGDLDTELHDLVVKSTESDLFDYINHGIDSIKEVFESAHYLYGVGDNNNIIVDALTKLIRFFKSYTVDLREFNILYILDHRYINALKILDKVKDVEGDIDIVTSDQLIDVMSMDGSYTNKDRIAMTGDIIRKIISIYFREDIYGKTKYDSEKNMRIHDEQELSDFISSHITFTRKDHLYSKELVKSIVDIMKKEDMFSKLTYAYEKSMKMGTALDFIDTLSYDKFFDYRDDRFNFNEMVATVANMMLETYLFEKTKYLSDGNMKVGSDAHIRDVAVPEIRLTHSDFDGMSDSVVKGMTELVVETRVPDKTRYSSETQMKMGTGIAIMDNVINNVTHDHRDCNSMRDEITIIREMS